MEWQEVESSSLKAIAYDKETETLGIKFNNGGIYHYFDVSMEVYQELLNAESLGRYFLYNIRECYGYRKVKR